MSQEQGHVDVAPVTPEDPSATIDKLSADLQARIVATQREAERLERERTENLKKRVSERESLIASGAKLDSLLANTQKNIEPFREAEEKGLFDEKAKGEFVALQNIVSSLEGQRQEISRQIAALTAQSNVVDALFDAANQENVRLDTEKNIQAFLSEVKPQMEELGKEAFQSIQRRNNLIKKSNAGMKGLSDEDVRLANEQVQKIHKEVQKKIGERNRLFGFIKDETTAEQLQARLEEERKKLGIFDRSQKQAVDLLLSPEYLQSFERVRRYTEELKEGIRETNDPSSPHAQRIAQSLFDITKKAEQIDWKGYHGELDKYEYWGNSAATYNNFVDAIRRAAKTKNYNFDGHEIAYVRDVYEKLLKESGTGEKK